MSFSALRGRVTLAAWGWAVLLFLVLPVVIVVPLSFSSSQYLQFPPPGFSLRWYQAYFASDAWVSATITSLQVAVLTVLLATPLGMLASFGLVRERFPGQRLINALVLSPMIVPTIVVAVATYFAFARVQLVGTMAGVVLAHTALSVPLVVINVTSALVSFDDVLEQAAMSLGANRFKTFWYVTLPLIRPGLLAGALFAFLVSFDELLVAMFVAGVSSQTLPVKMWASLQQDIDPTIAAISSLLIGVSCVVICGGEILRYRALQRRGARTSVDR